MTGVTYYVALPFAIADDGPVPREAIECTSASAAIIRAEILSQKEGNIGAIAFSRTGDPSERAIALSKRAIPVGNRFYPGAPQAWHTDFAGSEAARGVKATMRAARTLVAAAATIGSS